MGPTVSSLGASPERLSIEILATQFAIVLPSNYTQPIMKIYNKRAIQ